MGYAVGSLISLLQCWQSARLTTRRAMDLGSQDVTIFDDSDLQQLLDLVCRLGDGAHRLRQVCQSSFPAIVTAREVFTAAGFDYSCCDVDQRPGTEYIDFNTMSFDSVQYGEFDLVMNAGTTEHLSNPVPAFFLMHSLCRTGGLLFHEVPLSGWFNHGLINLTPKFWHTLTWANSYEVLTAFV